MPKPALAAPCYPDKLNLMMVLDADGQPHPVRTVADWQRRRAHILANLQLVMGELPSNRRPCPLDMQILEKIETVQCVRLKITYSPEPGDRVPAYLFIPRHLTGKAPAVLCLHQTTALGKGEPAGVGGLPNLHYALELAQRGYVTLAPDYPNFGDYQCDPYAHGYASATMKGILNHRRALDLLQSLPEVDATRLGVTGASGGGTQTFILTAVDDRVTAAAPVNMISGREPKDLAAALVSEIEKIKKRISGGHGEHAEDGDEKGAVGEKAKADVDFPRVDFRNGARGILTWIEMHGQTPARSSLEIMNPARKLADQLQTQVTAVVTGHN
ncbi:MAG: acetylxylan esterase, partial [Armatimonadota bacterium]